MHKIHKTLYKVGTKIQFNRTKNPDDFHGLRIRDFDILYNNLRVNSKRIQIDKHVKPCIFVGVFCVENSVKPLVPFPDPCFTELSKFLSYFLCG